MKIYVLLRMSNNYEIVYKVILLGNSGVGKTSFFHRLINGEIPDGCLMTIGVDFGTLLQTVEGHQTKIHIWDTAGQESFRSIVSSYYRNAVGALVFFALDDLESLKDTKQWVRDLLTQKMSPCKIVLVGHKSDQPNKLDSTKIAEFVDELSAEHKETIYYTEASARTGQGVQEAMDILVQHIYREWPINKKKEHCLSFRD
jgi:small GTP-binding protein